MIFLTCLAGFIALAASSVIRHGQTSYNDVGIAHHGLVHGHNLGHGVVTHGHGVVAHGHGVVAHGHGVVAHGHGLVAHGHGVVAHGHGILHGDGHVVPAVREVVVPSHRVNLGHVNIQGIGQTVNEGSTFSKSISHSRASDVKHKHVHNDIVHLSAHHHDHTNVHKNIHDIHNHVHDHHKHIKKNYNHIHDKTHDHTVFHDHRTEDHQHEQHNFQTHDASHSASTGHVDHGLTVNSAHGHGPVINHGLAHKVAVGEHSHVVLPAADVTHHGLVGHGHHTGHVNNHVLHGNTILGHAVHHGHQHHG